MAQRRRRIKTHALKELVKALVGENHMEFARRVAGEGAAKKAVEKCRRQYLKYVTDKPASKTKYMTASTAARYAAVLGAPEDAFLEPYEDPREREARRLEARAQKLRLALRDGP